jgi:hypothetical protein
VPYRRAIIRRLRDAPLLELWLAVMQTALWGLFANIAWLRLQSGGIVYGCADETLLTGSNDSARNELESQISFQNLFDSASKTGI